MPQDFSAVHKKRRRIFVLPHNVHPCGGAMDKSSKDSDERLDKLFAAIGKKRTDRFGLIVPEL